MDTTCMILDNIKVHRCKKEIFELNSHQSLLNNEVRLFQSHLAPSSIRKYLFQDNYIPQLE